MTKHITAGEIILYSGQTYGKPERYASIAVLPENMHADWNGTSINLLDWKVAEDKQSVTLTYQTRDDLYAPIIESTLAFRSDIWEVKPPRGKNWRWSEFSNCWINQRTGERVSA